jgi:hypothetical protein
MALNDVEMLNDVARPKSGFCILRGSRTRADWSAKSSLARRVAREAKTGSAGCGMTVWASGNDRSMLEQQGKADMEAQSIEHV